MFLATKYQGVRRLSILGGIVVAIWFKVLEHRDNPYYPHTIGTAEFWLNAGFGFLVGWICVRFLAWVIAGFLEDRKSN
jgi:hypothetical protein